VAELTRPALRLDCAGTPESAWQASRQLRHLRPWTKPAPPTRRCVILAPHPDDEILGVGGTWALLSTAGIDVVLVAVTDGENSHPGRRGELRQRRPLESAAAAACLGVATVRTVRLGHPDGGIAEPRLRAQLARLVRPGDLVLAPWDHDGHPDHDRVGRAARAVAGRRQAELLCYLVWAWHWAAPDGLDLPWDKALRVELGPDLTGRKQAAVRCFATQLTGPDPILPSTVIERLTRPYEVLLGQ
jgi:LmbE family N-acetylglucosaminyl deacetylase